MSDENEDVRDVFISTRTVGKTALGQLRLALREEELSVYSWRNTRLMGEAKHREATTRMIRQSRGAVVIMGDNMFKPSDTKKVCFQKIEVSDIIERNTTEGGDYPVWFIIMQRDGKPGIEEFSALLKPHAPGLNAAELEFIELPEGYASDPPPIWHELLGDVAATVRKTLSVIKARQPAPAPPIKETPNQPPPSPETASANLTDMESAYLRRAIGAWIDGRDANASENVGDGAFDFKPQRFITLLATEASADTASAREDETQARPVTHWLFDPAALPIVLRGTAGSGNTCTLAVTALTFAARLSDELARSCQAGGAPVAMQEASNALGAISFVPVALKARRIADFLGDGLTPTDAVYAAIAATISGADATGVTPASMRARMMARPFAILVDELDRLSTTLERDVLKSLRDVHLDFAGGGSQIKLIASARPSTGDRVDPFIHVALKAPTVAQRDAFFKAYADGRDNAKEDLDLIEQAASKLQRMVMSTTGANGSETFDTPLLLNAFCWRVLERDFDIDASESQISLCRSLTTFLLERLPQRDSGGVATPDLARKVLRELAIKGLEGEAEEARDGGFGNVEGDVERKTAQGIVKALSGKDDAGRLLDLLVGQTGLLERVSYGSKRDFFRVKGLFADYFAAEHIEDFNRPEEFLAPMAPEAAARTWRQALVFACSLMFSNKQQKKALELIYGMVARARAGRNAEEQSDWFFCAASCLAALAPSLDVDQSGPVQQPALDAAADCYGAISAGWAPRQRAQALAAMSAASRRDVPSQTRKAVNGLWRKALTLSSDWIDVPDFKHPAGGGEMLRLSGMPLLVAHYHEFLDGLPRREDRVFTATRSDEEGVVIRNDDPPGAAREAGADVWAELSAAPASPITFITYFEAVSYCEWLTKRLKLRLDGDIIRLPTMSEWRAIAKAIVGKKDFAWGDEDPGSGEHARVNWRGAQIGQPTPPGAFPSYGRPDLYDFGTNVTVWTTPERGKGEVLWPPTLAIGEEVQAVGGHFASRLNEISSTGAQSWYGAMERSRERGVRLVRTRRVTGWNTGR